MWSVSLPRDIERFVPFPGARATTPQQMNRAAVLGEWEIAIYGWRRMPRLNPLWCVGTGLRPAEFFSSSLESLPFRIGEA